MTHEEWFKNYQDTIPAGSYEDDSHVTLGEYECSKESWNAALLNLPKCETCSHWESDNDNGVRKRAEEKRQENKKFKLVVQDGFRLCYVDGYEHCKNFGCNFHSKIEQLRKDNDN